MAILTDGTVEPPRLPIQFRKRCEEIATLQRFKLGFKAFEPLDAYKLAESLDATIYALDQLPGVDKAMVADVLNKSGWSAAISQRKPLVIIHNPTRSVAWVQSDLMHELAHVLLDHPLVALDAALGNFFFCKTHEDEATYLGGCLQIPKRAAEWAFQKKFTIEQAQEYFKASREMVMWRCRVSGIELL